MAASTGYSGGNDRFNAEAAAWDSNPDVHRASDGALEVILKRVAGMTKDVGGELHLVPAAMHSLRLDENQHISTYIVNTGRRSHCG